MNISSLYGLMAVPSKSAFGEGYDASKIVELFETKLARTTAERAAAVISRGVATGRARVLVGADAKALDLLVRLAGSYYQRPVARLFARSLSRAT